VTVTNWSSFQELRVTYESGQPDSVTTHSWDDSWRASMGANYRWSDKVLLRAGAAVDATPVPDEQHRTPRIPTTDFYWLTAGARYFLSRDMQLDFAYGYITTPTTKIDNTLESNATPHRLTGSYKQTIHVASAQLNWQF